MVLMIKCISFPFHLDGKTIFSFLEVHTFPSPTPAHTDADLSVCDENAQSLFCKSTINLQFKPTQSNLLNPTIPAGPHFQLLKPRGIFANEIRSSPKDLLLIQRTYHPLAMHCSVVTGSSGSCGAGREGSRKTATLPGYVPVSSVVNSSLSSVSWNHLQTPAVIWSFTFSHKKQMHLDTRFLTAFSGIHQNTLGEKIYPVSLSLCNSFKHFLLQELLPSTTSPPPLSPM